MKICYAYGPLGSDHPWYADKEGRYGPGEEITLNGEVWFHPYNGSRPTKLRSESVRNLIHDNPS